MDYVAGFLFSAARERVVLVEKSRPDWQKGHLNGVRDKIERSDTSPVAAMVREFEEDAGLLIHEWQMFCRVKNRGSLTHFFSSFAEVTVEHVSGQEAEKISAYPVPEVAGLIPRALDDAVLEADVNYAP